MLTSFFYYKWIPFSTGWRGHKRHIVARFCRQFSHNSKTKEIASHRQQTKATPGAQQRNLGKASRYLGRFPPRGGGRRSWEQDRIRGSHSTYYHGIAIQSHPPAQFYTIRSISSWDLGFTQSLHFARRCGQVCPEKGENVSQTCDVDQAMAFFKKVYSRSRPAAERRVKPGVGVVNWFVFKF